MKQFVLLCECGCEKYINIKDLIAINTKTNEYWTIGLGYVQIKSKFNEDTLQEIKNLSNFVVLDTTIINVDMIIGIKPGSEGTQISMNGGITHITSKPVSVVLKIINGESVPLPKETPKVRISIPINKTHVVLGTGDLPDSMKEALSKIDLNELSVRFLTMNNVEWSVKYAGVNDMCCHEWQASLKDPDRCIWEPGFKYRHKIIHAGKTTEYEAIDAQKTITLNGFEVEYLE